MFKSFSFQTRMVLRLVGGCVVASLAGVVVPAAQAQLPSLVAYGTRNFYTQPSSCSGTIGKMSRDAAGDIFITDPGLKCILEIPVSGPMQAVLTTADASMTNTPASVASDAAGNLYVLNSGSLKIIKIPRNANGTYNTAGETSNTVLAGNPITNGYANALDVVVDPLGNMYVSTTAGNTSPANPLWTGKGILVVGPSAPNGAFLYEGATLGAYYMAVDAAGDLFFGDSVSVYEITAAQIQASIVSGTALTNSTATVIGYYGTGTCPGCTAITTPKYTALDSLGNLYVSGGTIPSTFVLPNTNGTYYTTYALPATIASNSSSNNYFVVDNQGNLYGNAGALDLYGGGKAHLYSAPYAAGGTGSSTTPASGPTFGLLFTAGTSFNSVVASSDSPAYGGTGNSFASYNTADITGTYCIPGTSYTVGQTCNVEAGYKPYYPGTGSGSLNFLGGSAITSTNLLTSLVVDAAVSGPTLTVDTGSKTQVGATGSGSYAFPAGIALDNTGAMYVADSANNTVYKFAAGSTSSSAPTATFGTGLSGPTGTAIDSAGNLFILDTGNNRVVYYANNSGTFGAQTVLSTGSYSLTSPHGIAVDGFGNLYVGDTGNARVLIVPNPTIAAVGQVALVGSGFTSPYGIAVDKLNNVYVADKGANVVYEVPGGYGLTSTATVNAGSGAITLVGSGYNSPTGVAVDASGTVFVADSGNARISKVPLIGTAYGTPVALFSEPSGGLAKPYGIALDATGDLYFTDVDLPGVYFVQRSAAAAGTASTLTFGSVAVSGVGTLAATLSNGGYLTALTESLSTSPAAPYSLGTNGCSTASPLATGASCTVSVSFTGPSTTDANQAGTIAFTSTELNATTSPATNITLSGESTGAVSTVVLTGDSTVTYGEAETYTLTAKDTAGNPAASANGAFTVNITGTASSSASVTLTNGVGNFFLPSLGVGSYSLAASVASVAASALPVVVTKASLTVTANNASKIFDQVNPVLSLLYAGLVNGDSASVVTGTAPTISTTATRVSAAGSYPIAVTGGTLTAVNYILTNAPGTLTITGSAPQVILFTPLPNFTHATTVTLSATTTSGLPVSYTVIGGTVSGSALTIGAAGTVIVTANQGGNNSYAPATSVTRSFTAQ